MNFCPIMIWITILFLLEFHFFLILFQPKFNGNTGNYGYYHSNTTGNYGNYNPAYTSSPASQNSNQVNSHQQVIKPHTYDNFNPNLEVAPSLNIDKAGNSNNHLATNRYSLHVRASPISPTYSQFSSGVSVKNAYPPIIHGGNGYGGGGLKNASFDYVPSEHLRNYRYSVPDNYAVYVNSTTSPLPVVPIHEQTEVKSGSSLATHV